MEGEKGALSQWIVLALPEALVLGGTEGLEPAVSLPQLLLYAGALTRTVALAHAVMQALAEALVLEVMEGVRLCCAVGVEELQAE